MTVRLPLPLPVGVQLSENARSAVPPADTLPVWGFAPLSVQFPATPKRATA